MVYLQQNMVRRIFSFSQYIFFFFAKMSNQCEEKFLGENVTETCGENYKITW